MRGRHWHRKAGVRVALGGVVVMVAAVAAVGAEADEGPDFERLIRITQPALVAVRYMPQASKGVVPGDRWTSASWSRFGRYYGGDGLGQALREHRAAEVAGLLVSEDLVLTGDLPAHERFIKRIEVVVGGTTYPAAVDGFAVSTPGCFPKLKTPAKGAKPLTFDAKAAGPYYAVIHGRRKARWTTRVKALGSDLAMDETGRRWREVAPGSVLVTATGVGVGVSMGSELPVDDSWKGSPLTWKRLSVEQMRAALARTETLADQGLVKVHLKFRVKVKSGRDPYMYRDPSGERVTEKDVVGVVMSPETVLVLAKLNRATTARLETITIHAGDTKRPATFVGTLDRYGALLVRLQKGAAPLKPVPLADGPVHGDLYRLLIRAQVDCSGDRRVAYYRPDRCVGRRVGRDELVWPQMQGGGVAFHFDLAGRLTAVPVTYREKVEPADRYGGRGDGYAVTCPVTLLKPILANPDAHFDVAIVPVSERDEDRLVWLGVEVQPLTRELAKLKRVSELTKNGTKGALISYVYPGSPAAAAGVTVGDVLVRIEVEGEEKPIDVRAEAVSSQAFPWDRLDAVPDQYLDRIPQPWPSRLNTLTRTLTALGPGKKMTAVFARDGEERPVPLQLVLAPDDYRSAERFKHPTMGLTVKALTYDVRRYCRLAEDAPGVVVSKIEPGGKAAVAKIKPYELITQVNGKPVKSTAEFKTATAEAGIYQLAIKRMHRRRLVKLEITAATPTSKPAAATGG